MSGWFFAAAFTIAGVGFGIHASDKWAEARDKANVRGIRDRYVITARLAQARQLKREALVLAVGFAVCLSIGCLMAGRIQ